MLNIVHKCSQVGEIRRDLVANWGDRCHASFLYTTNSNKTNNNTPIHTHRKNKGKSNMTAQNDIPRNRI